ncbi:MAG: thioesterase domain-containing protein, partial [Verrucomicrobiota bacterium]
HFQPVPIGVPGELFIGGDGLARGYWNRPELTAQKFAAFTGGERLYRTGDKVRYRAEGTIEFLGRMDNQVKIRGFRIELEEIQAVLQQHPLVDQAVLLTRTDAQQEKSLAAYIVPKPGSDLSPASLRSYLEEKLPRYMIPSSFSLLPHLPLNPNGKVDKAALLASNVDTAPIETYIAPRDEVEGVLQNIWEEALCKKPIGVHDNFFDLGGHSLLAVRLFAQIEKRMAKKIPLSLLFKSPTIAGIASALQEDMPIETDACLIEIQPKGTRPPLFWLHTLGGGGGGGVLRYQKLSQLLGPDQPSYGLVAPAEPFAKMEAMAAHYIKAMRKIQPVGPYHLGGYCFGGVVAFEMAQQLHAHGEKIGLLALLDSAPANISLKNTEKTTNVLSSFSRRLSRILHQSPSEMLAMLKRKSKKLERKFFFLFNKNSRAEARTPLDEIIDMSSYPPDYKRYAEVHWRALTDYYPKLFPGKITLFQTGISTSNLNPEAIWKNLAAGLEVKNVSGSHEKMLDEPTVQSLANELQKCLGHGGRNDAKADPATP